MTQTIFSRIVATCAVFVLATPAMAEPEIILKLHHFLSSKSPAHTKMLVPWTERVEKESDGRLKIEVYPAMTLGGKPPQLIRQLRDGVVDIVWSVNGYTPGIFVRTEVFELPFVHTNNAVATNLAMRDLFDTHLAADYAGVKVLALHVHGGNGFHMVDTPVRTASDLVGKKIRTPTRTGSWILEALGASPIGMPVPELPQALSRKVLDGALIPWEIIPPLKLQELTKYQIEGENSIRFGNTVFQISMNEDSWNNLPSDLQKIVTDTTDENWLREIGELWTSTEVGGLNAAIKAGNEHIELDDAEMARIREKLEPVVERWVDEVSEKGVDGGALVDAARAAIKKHSAQ